MTDKKISHIVSSLKKAIQYEEKELSKPRPPDIDDIWNDREMWLQGKIAGLKDALAIVESVDVEVEEEEK